MGINTKEYDRAYKSKTAVEEKTINIKFDTKNIKKSDIEKLYSSKVSNEAQQKLLNNILDLIDLIDVHKRSLEELGAVYRSLTGTVKTNPSEKALRESILQLSKLIKSFEELPNSDKGLSELDKLLSL